VELARIEKTTPLMNQLQSPNHSRVRKALRIAGPLILIAGLVFVLIGMISFFSSMSNSRRPEYFWCAFLGMPLMFVGVVMSKFG
jgi:uncharacterized membrane protein